MEKEQNKLPYEYGSVPQGSAGWRHARRWRENGKVEIIQRNIFTQEVITWNATPRQIENFKLD